MIVDYYFGPPCTQSKFLCYYEIKMMAAVTGQFVEKPTRPEHVYISLIFWLFKPANPTRLVFIQRELSYIYVSELKMATFSCQVDDLVVPIRPYQFFNADRRCELNTVL